MSLIHKLASDVAIAVAIKSGNEKTAGVMLPSIKDWLLTRGMVKNTLKDMALNARHVHARKAHRLYAARKAEQAMSEAMALQSKADALDPGFIGGLKESLSLSDPISGNISSWNREAQRAAIRENRRLAERAKVLDTASSYGKGALIGTGVAGLGLAGAAAANAGELTP